MRMRAGAYKLLMASTKREQILDAAKSLLTCNARIKAYMTEAQRMKEQADLSWCAHILLLQENVCAQFFEKSNVVRHYEGFKEMFLYITGLQVLRMERLARAK